jgi:hypothetical protein
MVPKLVTRLCSNLQTGGYYRLKYVGSFVNYSPYIMLVHLNYYRYRGHKPIYFILYQNDQYGKCVCNICVSHSTEQTMYALSTFLPRGSFMNIPLMWSFPFHWIFLLNSPPKGNDVIVLGVCVYLCVCVSVYLYESILHVIRLLQHYIGS